MKCESCKHEFERKVPKFAVDDFVVDNPVVITDPAAAFYVTLPDGAEIGQEFTIVMSSNSDGMNGYLSVSNHETSVPERFTHDAADEYTTLIWTGVEWATVNNTSTL